MTYDPHQRFVAWLLAGAQGDPTRDLALHASVCPDCIRGIAAQDALAIIDVGRAPLPISKAAPRPRALSAVRVARIVALASSLVLVGWAIAFSAAQLTGGEKAAQVLGATGRPGASLAHPTPSPHP
jgi:hypothetical protein